MPRFCQSFPSPGSEWTALLDLPIDCVELPTTCTLPAPVVPTFPAISVLTSRRRAVLTKPRPHQISSGHNAQRSPNHRSLSFPRSARSKSRPSASSLGQLSSHSLESILNIQEECMDGETRIITQRRRTGPQSRLPPDWQRALVQPLHLMRTGWKQVRTRTRFPTK